MNYSVRITLADGRVAYLSHKDRTVWRKRTARFHALSAQRVAKSRGYLAVELEEA